MKLLRLAPENTKFPFMRFRRVSYPFSALLSLIAVALFIFKGMNFGIDFAGGTVIELRAKSGAAEVGTLRTLGEGLHLGDIEVQAFGNPADATLRFGLQSGGDVARIEARRSVSITCTRASMTSSASPLSAAISLSVTGVCGERIRCAGPHAGHGCRAPRQRLPHAVEKTAACRRLGIFSGEFADAGIGALERLVLHQHGLHQWVDGVRRTVKAVRDRAFSVGIARRLLELREPVKKVLNQLAFLWGHCALP